MVTNRTEKTKKLVELSVVAALIVVVQVICSTLNFFGIVEFTLALVPLVIGAAKHGPLAGTFLGFLLGLVNFINTFFNPSLLILFQSSPVLYILVCFGKTMAAGAVSGWIYRLLEKKNSFIGSCLAALAAPIVNTGIFFVFMALFFQDAIILASNNAAAGNVIYFIIVYVITWNFFIEFGVNAVFCPVIDRILRAVKPKQRADMMTGDVSDDAGISTDVSCTEGAPVPPADGVDH